MADEQHTPSADAEGESENNEIEQAETAEAETAETEAAEETAVEESSTEPDADVVSAAAEDTPAEEAVADGAPDTDTDVAEAPQASEPAADGESSGASEPRKRKRLPRALRRPRSKPRREKPTERKPIVRLEKPDHERGRRQERQGTVVSDAMDKTIVVEVDVIKAHTKYRKVVRRSTKFHAHDEQNVAKVGDVVRIVETRPLSKSKRWRLAEIVEAAK